MSHPQIDCNHLTTNGMFVRNEFTLLVIKYFQLSIY